MPVLMGATVHHFVWQQSSLDQCLLVHRPASHTAAYHWKPHRLNESGDAALASVRANSTSFGADPWNEAAPDSVMPAMRHHERHVGESSRTTRAVMSSTAAAKRHHRPQAVRRPAPMGLKKTVSYETGARGTPGASHGVPTSQNDGHAGATARDAIYLARVTWVVHTLNGGATLHACVSEILGRKMPAVPARPSLTRMWSACRYRAQKSRKTIHDHHARALTGPFQTHLPPAHAAYPFSCALIARGEGRRCVDRPNRSASRPQAPLDAWSGHGPAARAHRPIQTTVVVDWCCVYPCKTVSSSASFPHGPLAKMRRGTATATRGRAHPDRGNRAYSHPPTGPGVSMWDAHGAETPVL